jgi:hypothetical protein
MPERHLLLFVDRIDGKVLREPVHVDELGEGRYRLLYAPGMVAGIAAGDEFRLLDDDGRFEILQRSGNLTVQVYSLTPMGDARDTLVAAVEALGGTLDGSIEKGLTFTMPHTATFAAIEAVFDQWVAEHEGTEWLYGNVYSTKDGVTPLNWWVEEM